MRRHVATFALIAGTMAVGTFLPGEARAQCAFDQSSPNANDVLSNPRPLITIDFTDEFELQEIRVTDMGSGTEWPTDWAPVKEQVRRTEFRTTQPLPPGKYMVEWNGYLRRHHHPDGSSFSFTVVAEGDMPPASPVAAPPADGVHRVGPGSPYRAFLGGGAPQPVR